jgi:hypothetical protein
MIDIRKEDVILTRTATDGRFVIFTRTDVRPEWTLPWWCAMADTGSDGYGFLTRIDEAAAPAGWLARDLLQIIRARCALESRRRPHLATSEALRALDTALSCRWERGATPGKTGATLAYAPGGVPSPYAWTSARFGEFDLRLCPDPESREEGITPEQLLIVLDQLFKDASNALPYSRPLMQARGCVRAALISETKRLAAVRG